MQQPICPQDQLGSQQHMIQQMMLCPVRLVYETQVLVQPGEQIQPNQTIFINPQNPPPWIQNRTPPNQVFYVQQMPNNVMPIQQHIDQSQMYLQQNYANYQIPQQILAQNQEQIRPMQMMASNVIQNIGPNVKNERTVMPNYNQITNVMPNQVISRPVMPNVNQISNQISTQTEIQRQMYVRPQVNQVEMRPQIIGSPGQNMPQTFVQNIGHTRPMMSPNNPRLQQTVMPVANLQLAPKATNVTAQSNANNIVNIVNRNQVFRCIQPRPQFRPNISLSQGQIVVQNQNITLSMPNRDANNIYTINSLDNTLTRKRKSESPDEINKKVANTNQVTAYSEIAGKSIAKSNDIGVNTSPVHKNVNQNIVLKNSDTQTVKPVDNNQATVKDINETNKEKISRSPQQTETEKNVRNTVFTQARGRILNDKETLNIETVVVQNTPENTESDVTQVNENVQNEIRLNEIKQNNLVNVKLETKEINLPVKDNDKDSSKKNEIKEAISNLNKNENEKSKSDNDFILTHVLDGYVIQESNTAFPIRKPLKEKVIHTNTHLDDHRDKDDAIKNELIKENRNLDIPLLPFHFMHLNNEIEEKEEIQSTEEDKKDNPFVGLQPASIKSWTVNELAEFLSSHWPETSSLLQEHEIDGESLFLVSRTQLLKIGVNENHADILSEFVKN